MSYFETTRGQDIMESIAASLKRIAVALEENTRLMEKALQSESGGQHLAVIDTSVAGAAAEGETTN